MSYLKFDKSQLINLGYSLNRELLRSNMSGCYYSTTLNGCNTRKYHGLLVCPLSNFGDEKHLLLSSLDISVINKEEEINLGIHRYKGGFYDPKGHKYLRDIEFGQVPVITYRIGEVVVTIERLLVEKKQQILIRYTLDNAPENIIFRFRPFLAFRNIHSLSKANLFINRKYNSIINGISIRLYEGYPDFFMQFSKDVEYIPVPDWYYNIEYVKELRRGYEYLEDLFMPGYFELSAEPGESIIFSAGTENAPLSSLKQKFTNELNKQTNRFTFTSSLVNAGKQFIFRKKNETSIIAGFPWYDSITRQSFISLPGLALATNNNSLYSEVLNTCKLHLNNGLFPDNIYSAKQEYHSADAPLWFIWAIQQYIKTKRSPRGFWLNYCSTVKKILNSYKKSLPGYIGTTKEGLIYAEKENTALTWMDSYVNGKPVIQRSGLAVEVNALWYNAISFALEMAELIKDKKFVHHWADMRKKVGNAFLQTFCNEGHDNLADVVKNGIADWSVRPNMIIAAAMKYSPLSLEQKKRILSVAKQKLLTKRGLRTLSPDHLNYKGFIKGNHDEREASVHQGTVYPWLMQFFVEAYLQVHNKGGLTFLKQLMDIFEEEMTEHCVGTLSEMYEGDPPHKAKGALSQAWNVAGVLYALDLILNYK
jgi:predicted glycogen debranching enzyme